MSEPTTYLGSPEHPRTAAFVCYITIFGWLISYFWLYGYHAGNKSVLLHLRQSLYLHLATFIINALVYFLVTSVVIYIAVALALFAAWAYGVMQAINGRDRLIPVIGSLSQRLFIFIR